MSGVILITGASRGIGAATAKLAAQKGYDVAINYAGNEAAANTVAEDVRAQGRRAITVQADISSEAAVMSMFETVDAQLGRLNAFVNNAGTVAPALRVEEMSAERLTRIFGVNVIGSFICAREAVRRMSTKHGGKGGAIVNLSSVASRTGAPGGAVDYAVTKGAIEVFTKGLALEVASEGVRVNAVRPGLIDTEMHALLGQPDRAKDLGPTVPMGRHGTVEEVANCIIWLLSDEASYVTDTIIDVGGGR